MAEEITLHVDLPEIVETPVRTAVFCGFTVVFVYEHGHQGCGDWAVWTSVGGSVIAGGTESYSYERAIAQAHVHARRGERERLLYAQLRRLCEQGQGAAENEDS
jgi:hypothetical protein